MQRVLDGMMIGVVNSLLCSSGLWIGGFISLDQELLRKHSVLDRHTGRKIAYILVTNSKC
jgi:hypothetical protein